MERYVCMYVCIQGRDWIDVRDGFGIGYEKDQDLTLLFMLDRVFGLGIR